MTGTILSKRNWREYWEAFGERMPEDPFVQVGRTVNGVPVGSGQIRLLANTITERLQLQPSDTLLDLCCGNGLVTVELARSCRLVIGVDYSLRHIEEAHRRYPGGNMSFLHRSATELTPADFPDGFPTKFCMNQGLQDFTDTGLGELLQMLRRHAGWECVLYLTDVPDAGKLDAFCDTPARRAEFERRRATATELIGTWWDRDHIAAIFAAAGFAAEIVEPEPGRFTAHYRFDVLARRLP